MGTAAEETIVGLDIGTSKIAAVVAERDGFGNVTYIDGLTVEARGVRNGIVVDIADAAASIETVLRDLEDRCDRRLTSVSVSVGGPHVHGYNARGAGSIQPLGREITHDDITRAITVARDALPYIENRDIIHEIPRAYVVDGQAGVHDPHGMVGYEVEVEVHYATGVSTTIANLVKCVREAGVTPEMLVAAPLATGEAIRSAFEHTACMAVADIGAETTGVAVYADGSIWSSTVLPVGGGDITKDIATQFRIPLRAAEDVKRRYGHTDPTSIEEYELVDLPPSAGMDAILPRSELVRVIQERAYRLADALCPILEEARAAGIEPEVLAVTGGGAELPGLDRLLMVGLELPVVCGIPNGASQFPGWLEQRPAYTAAAGAALWYARYAPYGDGNLPGRRLRALPNIFSGVKRLFRVAMP